ncbi:MAG TPA: pyrimidine-nucleoside phosphorylase [Bacillus bacterium]|uniref:Pyrimidine-nucleoside phosphorylase n=1 Tax=Siminovitchia fordii TaxID=254759 RepID=A0ABQ4K356_9BACI|nr:pyrimidine-nucleoside phosphorylase [Siminovitchia fordii]GIN19548.1 pyrimidine-nucleoside phosphorylase [Siminovitchia fordii]HBZ11582.1 pyrimidine-nucleoside phosphorylase [Bacillus sp. (in: firmicutes)]
MRMVDIIEKKRDGLSLTPEEIRFVIKSYINDEIPDYQMSALLMSVYFQGMTPEETSVLTTAMAESGDQIDLSKIDGVKVDKHSTGGVGDTTTLILAPLVAAVGVPVAKMSGRGLGHTGGTIDKLEAVPGFHVEVSEQQFIDLVNKNKLAVVGQSGNLAPADKKLYSLRDVTATVNSIPLIASSIMSKKIAAGADAIVLDVKVGSGAFMKEMEGAQALASTMIAIGEQVGRKTAAVISDMNQPLGYAVGNALEVKEAIDTLKGCGPADLHELCLVLGSNMVVLAGKARNEIEARTMLEEAIANGKALEVFKTFLAAQGGDASVVDHPEKLPDSTFKVPVLSESDGFVEGIAADEIGTAAMLLGAGRATKDSVIDLSVGIVLHKKIGDEVKIDEPIATIHSNTEDVAVSARKIIQAYRFSNDQPPAVPLIKG